MVLTGGKILRRGFAVANLLLVVLKERNGLKEENVYEYVARLIMLFINEG